MPALKETGPIRCGNAIRFDRAVSRSGPSLTGFSYGGDTVAEDFGDDALPGVPRAGTLSEAARSSSVAPWRRATSRYDSAQLIQPESNFFPAILIASSRTFIGSRSLSCTFSLRVIPASYAVQVHVSSRSMPSRVPPNKTSSPRLESETRLACVRFPGEAMVDDCWLHEWPSQRQVSSVCSPLLVLRAPPKRIARWLLTSKAALAP